MTATPSTTGALLKVRGLRVDSGAFTLGPLDLRVDARDRIALVGPAASGKSVLLRSLAGLIAKSAGQLEGALAPEGVVNRKDVGFAFQNDALVDEWTALENVLLGTHSVHSDLEARGWLTRLGLGDAAETYPRALSGGMRKRVGLARALASRPRLLLLDDPTAGLDPQTAAEVMEQVWAQRTACIVATQDVDTVLPHVGEVLFLLEGQVAYRGAPDGLRDEYPDYAPQARVLGAPPD